MAYLGRTELKSSDIQLKASVTISGSSTNTVVLAWTAPNEQSLILKVNGVVQHTDAYSIAGSPTTITLASGNFADGATVEVVGINDIGTAIVPADGSVTSLKLADDAVTLAKMADDSVGVAELATTGTPTGAKFLQDDMAWTTVDSLPSQTGESGKFLTTSGSAASWAAVGGLSDASIWRLTSPFTISAGVEATISTNLEEDDSTSAGRIGSAMTQALGIFTFPSTGYWLIQAVMDGSLNGATAYMHIRTYTTIDNSSYSMRAYASQGIANQGYVVNATGAADFIIDVTDTTQCKCQFKVYSPQAVTMSGESDKNRTHFLFLKLGDT